MTITIASLAAEYARLATHFDDVKPFPKGITKAKAQERVDALRERLAAMQDVKADTFTPADLARDLGVNGKVLRAKIRRLRKDTTFPAPVVGNRYANEDRDIIIERVTAKA